MAKKPALAAFGGGVHHWLFQISRVSRVTVGSLPATLSHPIKTLDLATKFGGIGEFSCFLTVVILALQVWDLSRQLYQLEVPSRVLSSVEGESVL